MSQVKEFVAKLPDPVVIEEVTAEVPIDGKGNTTEFKGTFEFHRVPSSVLDELLAANMQSTGIPSTELFSSHRARVIARTVTENGEALSVDDVRAWPPQIVRAVFNVTALLNGFAVKAKEEAEKK